MIGALGPWQWSPAERLGGGGYSSVYLCRHPERPAGEWAIKVYDDPHYANTLEREVGALEALQGCAGVTPLCDHGRDAEGRLCIVTDRVPGVRLDVHVAKHGPLSLEQALSLLRQLLVVLECVHGRGWLHKDIKASNVLMADGRFTLLDWGVAEPLGDGRAESIRAKLEFVAPECFYGRHTVAGDFYALAWLAVHALSGALPYHFGEVRDADYRVAAHCMERPVLPEAVPAPLRPLLLGWLDKRPERRPVGYDLDHLLAAHREGEAERLDHLEFRQLEYEGGWLQRAARHGVPYARHHLGARLLQQGREREGLYWLEQAHEQGYLQSTYLLARQFSEAEGKVRQRGHALMREAAEAGSHPARYRLGMMLLKEERGEAREEALSWLRLAAEGGERRAQYELGALLAASGEGEAGYHLGRAADRGDRRAGLPPVTPVGREG